MTIQPEVAPYRFWNWLIWQRLFRQPLVVISVAYLVVIVILAAAAPLIAPYDPLDQDLMNALQAPSTEFVLGTDHLGRDTFSRIIFGAGTSLAAAFQAVTIAFTLGVSVGLLAGYMGGWVDRVTIWITETIFSLPLILVAISLIAVIGTGLTNAMIAVGIVLSTSYIRLTRGVVFSEREKLYVDSARVGGLSTLAILLRHILPNVAPALIVQTALTFGVVILIESSLSFLGIGIEVGQPSWGIMLSEARAYIRLQSFIVVPPGLAITFTVLAFNVLGDGLRDALASQTLQTSAEPTKSPPRIETIVSETEQKSDALLQVSGLEVVLRESGIPLLSDVHLEIKAGQTMGLVGESGSGKTLTMFALLGMLPPALQQTQGMLQFDGQALTGLSESQWQRIRGNEIAMIFQEPLTALNPSMTIGRHLIEPICIHLGLSQKAAKDRALELLNVVGIPNPAQRMDEYPHQFSGGMAQRVMIARALTANPRLLIADEPTTALDVTLQKQILDLLADLQDQFDMSMLLISHDLGVIARLCDETAVMYAGQIVERASTSALFRQPRHPYTADLLATMPQHHLSADRLPVIQGYVPTADHLPQGCRYHPRCRLAIDACRQNPIALARLNETHVSRCIRPDDVHLELADV